MLYDKKWDKPERDIRSLDSLIAWLETKDPSTKYLYTSAWSCLLAQYFTQNMPNVEWVSVGTETLTYWEIGADDFAREKLPPDFNWIAFGSVWVNRKHTFGAALRRAKQVRARNNGGPVRRVLGRLAASFGL